jgi:hypothetical protein
LNYTRVRLKAYILALMPGIVDPRPAQRAYLLQLRSKLEAAQDDEERDRLRAEIAAVEQSMRPPGGLLRRLLFGWGHGSVPW